MTDPIAVTALVLLALVVLMAICEGLFLQRDDWDDYL